MKILKDAGKFEVLNEEDILGDKVIYKIARAARTCYQSESDSMNSEEEHQRDLRLVKNLLKRGHHAMIEFGGMMIVRFSDISRGFTHEMVRHRLCSFAQESTRYVDESDLHVIVPPHKDEHEVIEETPTHSYSLYSFFHDVELMYQKLRKAGWKPEDARQVLPIATRSQIVVGANLREWMHIFDMRCAKAAHWEIRSVMLCLLRWCQANIPLIFDDYRLLCDGINYATRNKDE